MKNAILILSTFFMCLIVTQCAHLAKPKTIQQGNYLPQDKVRQLKIGMSQAQVSNLLGSPIVHNPFDNQRWDYAFSIQTGSKPMLTKHLVLYFQQGRLKKIENTAATQVNTHSARSRS